MISVTGPVIKRYKQFCESRFKMPLDKFVQLDDAINCGYEGYSGDIKNTMTFSDHVVENNGTLDDYIEKLKTIDAKNPEAIRPKWDTYFLQVAELVSRRSNCIKRAVGAVLVKDKKICSTGYNGTPFGFDNCNKGGCEQCAITEASDKDMDKCICMHAEQNAVFEVGKSIAKGGILYTTCFPCLLCAKAVLQAGVARIVYYREEGDNTATKKMLQDAGMQIEKHSPYVISSYLTLT